MIQIILYFPGYIQAIVRVPKVTDYDRDGIAIQMSKLDSRFPATCGGSQ